jgi:hypothetical protein
MPKRYLTNCAEGGETTLLTRVSPQSAPEERIAQVKPAAGLLLLFPHMCPHEGRQVVSLPKILLRGELLDTRANAAAEAAEAAAEAEEEAMEGDEDDGDTAE